MPNLITLNEYPRDSIYVRAVMCWPDEEQADKRRQFQSAEFVKGVVSEPGLEQLVLPVRIVEDLLDAPSWQMLAMERGELSKAGMQAGHIFLLLFLMDRLQDQLPDRGAKGASLDKAFSIASEWAKAGHTWGDGSTFSHSVTAIKSCWRKYRGVAHLWAAFAMNQISEYAPRADVFCEEFLPRFLETAAYLQMFGLTKHLSNKATKSSVPILEPSQVWLLDTSKHRPRILFPSNASEVFSDAPFMLLLKSYAAR